MQFAALLGAGCDKSQIYSDKASGASPAEVRPGYSKLLLNLDPGDVLMVWRLDRLWRGALAMLTLLADLASEGIEIVSLTQSIDTRNASGRFHLQMLLVLAEMERETIKERVQAGVLAARARGIRFGRVAALNAEQVADARAKHEAGQSLRTIARVLGSSYETIRMAVNRMPPYDA
jgi:DNA invertase Pin-like site-specific DNA recombinase